MTRPRALVGLALVFAAGLLALGALLGPATSTETRYAEMGREMLVSGDWVIPTLNGAPLLEKPPFEYWVTAASLWAFGVNDVAPRIPSVLAGLLVVLAVAAIARRATPVAEGEGAARTRGRLAALALLAMPAFLWQTYTISTDVWLVLTTTVAGGCLLASERSAGKPGLRVVLALHAALGVGLLVKGPLTLGLVLAAGVVTAVARRDARLLRPFAHPLGLATLVAIGLPWYLAADARIPGLLRDLVTRRLFGGLGSSAEFHSHAVWYVWVPLLGCMPWLATLPRAARGALARGGWRAGPWLPVLALALAAPVLFTFSASRLLSYASPAFPWIAVAFALGAPLATRDPDADTGSDTHDPAARARWRGSLVRACVGVATVTVGVVAWLAFGVTPRPAAGPLVAAVVGAALAVTCVAWPAAAGRARDPVTRAPFAVAGLTLALGAALVAQPFLLPAAKPLWEAVASRREPGDEVGMAFPYSGDWGLYPWYAHASVRYFDYPSAPMIVAPEAFRPDDFLPKEALAPWFRSPSRRWLMLRARDRTRPDWLGDAPSYEVARGAHYVVLTNLPLPAAGR